MTAVAHLFSGGVDSTLAASLLADRFAAVHLVTFTRPGFLCRDRAVARLERLRQRHPGVELSHRFLDVEPLFDELCGDWSDWKLYGPLAVAPCGVCKLAMHWRLLLYCLENGLRHASDGAAHGAEEYAEQNPRVAMEAVAGLYARFGVTKLSPAYCPGRDNEEELYRRGLVESPRVKRTAEDTQILCTQQPLFAMALRTLLSRRSFVQYEALQRRYLREKLRKVEERTRRALARKEEEGAGELLERLVRP